MPDGSFKYAGEVTGAKDARTLVLTLTHMINHFRGEAVPRFQHGDREIDEADRTRHDQQFNEAWRLVTSHYFWTAVPTWPRERRATLYRLARDLQFIAVDYAPEGYDFGWLTADVDDGPDGKGYVPVVVGYFHQDLTHLLGRAVNIGYYETLEEDEDAWDAEKGEWLSRDAST